MHFLMFAPNIVGNISGKLSYYAAVPSVSNSALTKLNSLYTKLTCNTAQNSADRNSACRNHHHNKRTQVKAAASCPEYTCAPLGFAGLAFPGSGSPDLQVFHLEGKRVIPDMKHSSRLLRQVLWVPDLMPSSSI